MKIVEKCHSDLVIGTPLELLAEGGGGDVFVEIFKKNSLLYSKLCLNENGSGPSSYMSDNIENEGAKHFIQGRQHRKLNMLL
ncbi:MAG: hypothetical protein KZQ98_20130 [Candidatus Thiodiazotropha sp. (ex Lucinoma borealis)]|nr:hypothetical protein [Candidatus Thiodiazotropha sp. (ex Lucinoma borealis)]